MTALLIICAFLLLIVTVVLWAPLVLELDSSRSVYRLDWWYLIRARVTPAADDLFIDGRILFFKKRWSVIELAAKRSEKKEKQASKKKKQQKKRSRLSWNAFKRIMHTFTVHRFDIALDTGDVITNAMLFPIAEVLHHSLRVRQGGFHINFVGDNHIDLKISNRAGRVAWAFKPSFITQRYGHSIQRNAR